MTTTKSDKYYYAIGRRKTAKATVRLYEGEGESTVNGKNVEEVYNLVEEKKNLFLPFTVTDTKGSFFFTAKTQGGGHSGQMGALRLAISRALVEFSADFKSKLKTEKLLTRDSRMVERKKPGLVKARKAPQYSKR